jgi:hypothetical protein
MANFDQPAICRDGSCLALTTENCPLLLPDAGSLDYLRQSESPVILGGLATMVENSAYESTTVVNWDLAFTEFNAATFGGLDGGKRPLLLLVCDGTAADVIPNFDHLALDAGVPGVLTDITPNKLLAAYQHTTESDYAAQGGKAVFFVSSLSADLRLADYRDRGLIWHFIGSPRVLAATIAALVRRIEPYVQARREENYTVTNADPPTDPLRVTLVTADAITTMDISSVLTTDDLDHPESSLVFNDELAIQQTDVFRQVAIESELVHEEPYYQAAIDEIRGNPPHIVIALATNEFTKVLPSLEAVWGNDPVTQGHLRPYYVLSHHLSSSPQLLATASQYAGVTPPLEERMLGVNFSLAHDAHSSNLYASYLSKLLGHYGTGELEPALPGTENFYDSAYGLIYSYVGAAANGSDVTATALRDAFQDRVFSTEPDAESVDIGFANVPKAMQVLGTLTSSMALWGTMGPPDFDRASGTRVSATAAWCIDDADSTARFVKDALLYDPTTSMFSDGAPGNCLEKY